MGAEKCTVETSGCTKLLEVFLKKKKNKNLRSSEPPGAPFILESPAKVAASDN